MIIGLWVIGFVIFFWAIWARFANCGLAGYARQATVGAAKKIIVVTIAITALFSLVYQPQVTSRLNFSPKQEAVSQRIFYGKIAASFTKNNALLGVGIGQFLPNFAYNYPGGDFNFYQPVHNIYLLISSEMGMLGLALFLTFLILVLRNFAKTANLKNYSGWLIATFMASVLVMGFFDHFLWTLQTGNFILWGTLGALSSAFLRD